MSQPALSAAVQLLSLDESGLAGLQQLTNLNDITRLLHEMLARERSVNAELEGLLSKRSTLEGGLVTLQSSTAEVRDTLKIVPNTVVAGAWTLAPCTTVGCAWQRLTFEFEALTLRFLRRCWRWCTRTRSRWQRAWRRRHSCRSG